MKDLFLFTLSCLIGLFIVGGCTKAHTVVYQYSDLRADFISYLDGGEIFDCVDVELDSDVDYPPVLSVGEMKFVFGNLKDIENFLPTCGFKHQNGGWHLWWEGGYASVSFWGNRKVMLRVKNSLRKDVLLSLGGVAPMNIPSENGEVIDRFGNPTQIIKHEGVFH